MAHKLFTLVFLLIASAILLASNPPSVKSLQVTIGASTTQVTTTNTFCKQIFLQNNATHTMRVGDSTTSSTKGVLLASGSPGGSITVTSSAAQSTGIDLSDWWVNGTNGDVLDASCTQ